MVQYLEKYKQNIAIDMRKRGLSYSEIGNRLHIPKSTLSYWLKDIKLTSKQLKRLDDKRIQTAKKNARRKKQINISSEKDIKEISKKELWLMGIMLYWKNGNKSDLKKGVHFSSSDPHMIKLFLRWLKEIGGIKEEEIKFDIFSKKKPKNKIIGYWSKITGFSKKHFSNIYFQKSKFLRVKVVQSSMLAHQIAGWIEGLKNINNL